LEKISKGKGKYGFDVKKIELELQFTVTKVGKAGINLAIVEAGVERDKEEIQKITIELDPYKIVEQGITGQRSSSYTPPRKDRRRIVLRRARRR